MLIAAPAKLDGHSRWCIDDLRVLYVPLTPRVTACHCLLTLPSKAHYAVIRCTAGQAHLLYLNSITSMAACHVVHVLCSHLGIIVLCLHLGLLTLLLGFMLLLHVLDVGTGIPVCRHLRYGKVPLPTCRHMFPVSGDKVISGEQYITISTWRQ